jgi:formylglycine-generating enzyme required for sulfatase activity
MSFEPNKLGLFDLGGNVWEWCEDWYDAAKSGRVLRGNSWRSASDTLRSSLRINFIPAGRDHSRNWGFRVVLEMSGASAR